MKKSAAYSLDSEEEKLKCTGGGINGQRSCEVNQETTDEIHTLGELES